MRDLELFDISEKLRVDIQKLEVTLTESSRGDGNNCVEPS